MICKVTPIIPSRGYLSVKIKQKTTLLRVYFCHAEPVEVFTKIETILLRRLFHFLAFVCVPTNKINIVCVPTNKINIVCGDTNDG